MADDIKKETATVEVDNLKAIVEEMVAKQAESMEKRMKEVRLSENDETIAKAKAVAKRNPSIEFLKAMANRDDKRIVEIVGARAKYLNETTTTAGAYLVPEEFETEVTRKVNDYSVLRRNALVLPMGSDVKNLNTLTGNATAYYTSEASGITSSDLTFGAPVLTARKIACITEWTNELAEDSEAQLLSLLQENIAEAIALVEQKDIVSGATSGSLGLLADTGVTLVTMASGDGAFTDTTWGYLRDMITALQGYSMNEVAGAKFFMHPSIWATVSKLAPTNSTYYGNPVVTNEQAMFAWGVPVELVNEFPTTTATQTKFAILANLRKHLVIGDRAGLRIKILGEGTVGSNNLGEQDMEAIRVIKRSAHTCVLPSGIVALKTSQWT